MKAIVVIGLVLSCSFASAKISKVSNGNYNQDDYIETKITGNGQYVFLNYKDELYRKELSTGRHILVKNSHQGRVRVSADGLKVAYQVKSDVPNCLKYEVKDLVTGIAQLFVGEHEVLTGSELSPNGQFFVVRKCQSEIGTTLEIHDLFAGTKQELVVDRTVYDLSFSADSQYLIYTPFTYYEWGGEVGIYNIAQDHLNVLEIEGFEEFREFTDCIMAGNNEKIFCSVRNFRGTYDQANSDDKRDIAEIDIKTKKVSFHNQLQERALLNGFSWAPRVSADGKILFFLLKKVPIDGDGDETVEILVRKNLETGEISNIAKAYKDTVIEQLSISFDGKFVNFWSDSPDLMAPDGRPIPASYLWQADSL